MDSCNCYHCQSSLNMELGQKIGRHDECPNCKRSLRCCKMCSFYDQKSYNECREPNAERVVEKDRSNFCSYFTLSFGNNNNTNSKDELLAKAQALFKF